MLYVSEYTDMGSTPRGSSSIPLEPPVRKQAVAVTAGSVLSEPFQTDTCIVSLLSDEDCLFDIGSSPDATANVSKLMAGIEKIVSVPASKGFRVAVTAADLKSIAKMDQMDSFESLVKLLAFPDQAQQHFAVMADHVARMNASAKELRDASAENKTVRDQLIQSTEDATKAWEDATKAKADIADRERTFDKDAADQAAKVKADQATLDERAKALEAREAEIIAGVASVNKKAAELASRSNELDTREADLALRVGAADAAKADYEARIAKLKALAA